MVLPGLSLALTALATFVASATVKTFRFAAPPRLALQQVLPTRARSRTGPPWLDLRVSSRLVGEVGPRQVAGLVSRRHAAARSPGPKMAPMQALLSPCPRFRCACA